MSMEEYAEWLKMTRQLLPWQNGKYVSVVLSRTVQDRYSLFRGLRYADIPDKVYDFVFVDVFKYESPLEDGGSTFDFDFIHVLRNAEKPVGCLIDKHLSTAFALQLLLGMDKVKYSAIAGLGCVQPCAKSDLDAIAMSILTSNFAGSLRVFGNSRLSIVENR